MSPVLRTSLAIASVAMLSQDAPAVVPSAIATPGIAAAHQVPAPQFETLMVFGAGSIFFLVVCRLYQHEARAFAIGTVLFSAMASAYGFLQGAWPLGIALAAYAIVSLRSRPVPKAPVSSPQHTPRNHSALQPWEQSRLSRMFGPG